MSPHPRHTGPRAGFPPPPPPPSPSAHGPAGVIGVSLGPPTGARARAVLRWDRMRVAVSPETFPKPAWAPPGPPGFFPGWETTRVENNAPPPPKLTSPSPNIPLVPSARQKNPQLKHRRKAARIVNPALPWGPRPPAPWQKQQAIIADKGPPPPPKPTGETNVKMAFPTETLKSKPEIQKTRFLVGKPTSPGQRCGPQNHRTAWPAVNPTRPRHAPLKIAARSPTAKAGKKFCGEEQLKSLARG